MTGYIDPFGEDFFVEWFDYISGNVRKSILKVHNEKRKKKINQLNDRYKKNYVFILKFNTKWDRDNKSNS